MQDRVFTQQKKHIVDFAFNEDVVDVFPDMIRRSVPGYELVIPMGGLMAARHMGKSGTAFDLGCSLGASSLALLSQCDSPRVRVIGVMLNFVVQVLDPEHRLALLTRIAQQMNPDGLLILSEKVRNADPLLQTFYDSTHLAWKRANGYSELEVSQKRQALENVMRVETCESHVERLSEAGFNDVVRWFHCMNWVSFAASPTQVLYDPSE